MTIANGAAGGMWRSMATGSTAKFTREGLDRLMADVRHGRPAAVVCFKLDRLGRSLAHLAQLVAGLAAHNIP